MATLPRSEGLPDAGIDGEKQLRVQIEVTSTASASSKAKDDRIVDLEAQLEQFKHSSRLLAQTEAEVDRLNELHFKLQLLSVTAEDGCKKAVEKLAAAQKENGTLKAKLAEVSKIATDVRGANDTLTEANNTLTEANNTFTEANTTLRDDLAKSQKVAEQLPLAREQINVLAEANLKVDNELSELREAKFGVNDELFGLTEAKLEVDDQLAGLK
ncbi:hypothetical protein BDV95DRAFT_606503 [Massariosphaeria phaeospora]|uniref:Uncharacterized protein n=1 Tax=Massariosphaeria phaeospora TaxID=100035 RepID=A0A7C8I6E3_9PLEO|nr:hypothetical protein BDV95DRAFT_606503 [Massariosphaeria phaeospora]